MSETATESRPAAALVRADLGGRTALVTGASSGFGDHFARVLAASGAHVVAAARRTDRLRDLVRDIRAAGGSAEAATMDVTDAAAVEAAFESLAKVDVVVNNAGVPSGVPAISLELDEWRQTFRTNAEGAFIVAQAAARRMVETGTQGSIINIASITGLRPGPATVAYGASKAAIISLTESLAQEWARYGIRVNALAPGYFETDLNRDFLRSDYAEKMLKRVPQRRFGQLPDLDGPLLLLASDSSAFMTGAVIAIDGGHLVSVL
ncbi:MAG TPA: SDR family NAD(P)-dependent oxidoreductase [Caulobacteraceae bacterium]|nr:SDR family NAD(P)-dependent oxidoreductase [Caulobacteraceae bacterium]